VWIYPFRVSAEFSRFSWEPAVYKKDSDREDQLRRKGPATMRSIPVYDVCVCVCVYTFKPGCLINHYLILTRRLSCCCCVCHPHAASFPRPAPSEYRRITSTRFNPPPPPCRLTASTKSGIPEAVCSFICGDMYKKIWMCIIYYIYT